MKSCLAFLWLLLTAAGLAHVPPAARLLPPPLRAHASESNPRLAPATVAAPAPGGLSSLAGETRSLHDGRRVIQERDGNNTPLVSYTRGRDLSGSLEGAGGIGGLLARSAGYNAGNGNWSSHAYYHADGNGNVAYLLASDGSLGAWYSYDPYGNLASQSGPLAAANLYRFSSKEFHTSSGLYYYGFRWYDPLTQRWLNQDPIGERFDRNLYRFTYNNPINVVDPNGLWGIQFGNFNIGYGNPNLAFDSDSWNDLSQGASATADGLSTALTANGLFGLFDPNFFRNNYDPCDPTLKWSHRLGEAAGIALTIYVAGPQSSLSGEFETVTRFGPKGINAIGEGEWVMTGPASLRNWLMSGSPGRYAPWNYVTTQVPRAALGSAAPEAGTIIQTIKTVIGQRIYAP